MRSKIKLLFKNIFKVINFVLEKISMVFLIPIIMFAVWLYPEPKDEKERKILEKILR